MRRFRSKAIAFGLVALVGATSSSLADAAEGPAVVAGALPPPPATARAGSGGTAAARTVSLSASALVTAAIGTMLQLGEPLQAAGQLLERVSFSPETRAFASNVQMGPAPRRPLVDRTAGSGRSVGTGTVSRTSTGMGAGVAVSGGGGAALLQPTLSRVVNLISGTANAALGVPAANGAASPGQTTAGVVPQGPPAPAFALQAAESTDEQTAAAEPEELAAAAHAARTEEAFQARPDAASAIAASAPQYVVRPHIPGAPTEAALEQLRWCESGGNYASVSSGGWYRGAYQFDFSTWNSVASRWMPHLVGTDPATAAPADQDLLASALYSERGWQPWPNCGLGL